MGWFASRKAVKGPHKVENPMILVQCVDKTTGITYLK